MVERPASVVKELVENALDAGAANIAVEIEGGGRALVRVRDDGAGMDRADAELAVERHATSKLRRLQDLQSLASHGFRGEALPSIASVSQLLIRTRCEPDVAGTEVEVRHGRRVGVKDVGHPRGATVEVRDLFGAVPARRKFLRSDATETGHVAEVITLLALARPGVGFALRAGGRSVIEAPPVGTRRERLHQLLGGAALSELLPVDGGEAWCHVTGFVSRPERAQGSRPALRLFVNLRPVRDRALTKAIAEGYREAGVREARPEAFLFLEVPPHLVDVNVHPAKTEVRFADPRVAFAAVASAVRGALSEGARPTLVEEPRGGLDAESRSSRVAEAVASYAARQPERAREFPRTAPGATSAGSAPSLFPAGSPTVLGQHRNTYLVASDGEELLLVDQHTAHERVCFEALMDRLEARDAESQLLLAPVVTAFEPRLLPMLEEHAETLRGLGFDVEPFGSGSVRLRAMPPQLAGRDPGAALQAVLRDLLEREASQWIVKDARSRLAATLACHSAVRAGQALKPEAMTSILRELQRTRHPTLCPHGRPTSVRVPREDLSRWFGRTGWGRQ